MTCQSGLYGGYDEGKILTGNCTNVGMSLEHRDWFAFVCISRHNTPFLGKFHADSNPVPPFSRISSSFEEPIVPDDEQPLSWTVSDDANYKFDDELVAEYDHRQGLQGPLQLLDRGPASGNGGDCVARNVQFLQSFKSACGVRLTPEVCRSAGRHSSLDHQFYLMEPPVPVANAPEVLRNRYSSGGKSRVVTKYFAADSDAASMAFVKVQRPHQRRETLDEKVAQLEDVLKSSVRQPTKFRINGQIVDHFRNIQHQVHYDEDTQTCINVVLEVHYDFVWQGGDVDQVNVEVLMGNISLPRNFKRAANNGKRFASNQQSYHLTQLFSVDWKHKHAEDVPPRQQRSGNPGYEIGKPLLSIHSTSDDTNVTKVAAEMKNNSTSLADLLAEYSLRLAESEMHVWGSNPDFKNKASDCSDVNLDRVTFLDDRYSGCYLNLVQTNFSDCSNLIESIADIQKRLMPAIFLAKGGNYTMNKSEFFPIIHEPIRVAVTEAPAQLNQTNGSLIQEVSDKNATVKPVVLSAFNPFSPVVPVCRNVPYGVHLQVLYTRYPIMGSNGEYNKLRGAKVSYQYDDWSWRCTPHQNHLSQCKNVSRYALESSVEFTEIPQTWYLENASRFWIIQERLDCPGDSCWKDIMYPFTEVKTGDEIVFTSQFGMAFIPLSVIVLLLIKPYL